MKRNVNKSGWQKKSTGFEGYRQDTPGKRRTKRIKRGIRKKVKVYAISAIELSSENSKDTDSEFQAYVDTAAEDEILTEFKSFDSLVYAAYTNSKGEYKYGDYMQMWNEFKNLNRRRR